MPLPRDDWADSVEKFRNDLPSYNLELQRHTREAQQAWSNIVVSGTATGYVTFNFSGTSTLNLRTVELAWPDYAGAVVTTALSPITSTHGGMTTTYVALGEPYLTTLADGSEAVVINGQPIAVPRLSEGEVIERQNVAHHRNGAQVFLGWWLDLIREQDALFDDGMSDAERLYRKLSDYLYSEGKVQRRIQRLLDNDEAEFLRRIPERRAEQLLMRHLTTAQQADYHAHGYFYVIGQSGDRYRIRPFGVANVDVLGQDGEADLRLCGHPGGNLPGPDMLLGQKLAIEHDETEFRRRANVHYRRPHYTEAAYINNA